MSRAATWLRGALIAGVLAIAPLTSGADHIVIAGPVWYPSGPGTLEVNFIHGEIESTMCCAGSPSYRFGDGTIAWMSVGLNQYTQPGTYDGYLYRESPWEFLGTFPVEVQHVGAPPLDVGTVPNTVVTFAHTYPEAGPYTVTWNDCCLGSPQIPTSVPSEVPNPPAGDINSLLWELHGLALSGVQSEINSLWYQEIVPTFEQSVQAVSPLGVSGGTTTVVAI